MLTIMPRGKTYTEAEKQFIRDNWKDKNDRELSEEMDRSPHSVKNLRHKMGLMHHSKNMWTEEEDQILKDHYSDTPKEELLEMLPGRTIHAIYGRANKLDLSKDEEFVYEQNRELGMALVESEEFKKNRFEKGHRPANKGLKQEEYMSEEAIEKTKKTRFKKGHKPKNTLWDGAITIRHPHKKRGAPPQVFIRISEGNWELYRRYQYRKHFGPIPESMLVSHKDGNTLNCFPENLELITMAENARRNSDPEASAEALRKWREEHGGSPSEILSDAYVASLLAGGDPEIKEYILEERKELIKVARANYLLKREMREAENEKA